MAQCVLKSNGKIMPQRTLCCLKIEEITKNTVEDKTHEMFDSCFLAKLGDSMEYPLVLIKPEDYTFVLYEDNEEIPRVMPVDDHGNDVYGQPYEDTLI